MDYRKILYLTVFLFSLLLTTGCKKKYLEVQGVTMGTYYTIQYAVEKELPDTDFLHKEIENRLDNLNQQMSHYLPTSEISLFNQSDKVGSPFAISQEFAMVLKEAETIHQLTEGGLDITLAPLVDLWGFGPKVRTENSAPTSLEVEQYLQWIGIDKFQLTENILIKKIPQLQLNLSAIAKGFAVDFLSDYLEELGVQNYMVDIGGEIRVKGVNKDNLSWRLAIEKPKKFSTKLKQRIITLSDMSVATSGNYRNVVQFGDTIYSHTINPKTGYPIPNTIISITVIAPKATTADGLATGLGVYSREVAIRKAEELNVPIFLVAWEEGELKEYYTASFSAYLQ